MIKNDDQKIKNKISEYNNEKSTLKHIEKFHNYIQYTKLYNYQIIIKDKKN